MIETVAQGRTERVLGELFSALIGYSGAITPTTMQEDVPGWDSMMHIALVEELETRFHLRFTTEEMVEMNGVAAIKEILRRYGVSDA